MRRLTHLLAAALIVGALLAPAVASSATLGLVADDGFDAAGTAAWTAPTGMAALKAGAVRIDVRWPAVAPSAPANPASATSRGYQWAAIDAKVRAAAENGALVILAVGGTPDWARADGGRGGAAGDPAWNPRRASWRNFVAALATRYNGTTVADGTTLPRVAAFELWPSPNLATGLRPQRLASRLVAPGLFKQIVTTGAAEIRRVAATGGYAATIVSGGVARTDPASTADTAPQTFLRGMGRTRMAFDALGLRLAPPTGIEGPADGANLSVSDIAGAVALVDAIWPGQNRGLWITDYAAPSGPLEAGRTPDTQAAAVTTMLAAAANPRVGVAVWSGYADTAAAPYAGLRAVAPQAGAAGDAKPAWTAWIAVVDPPVS